VYSDIQSFEVYVWCTVPTPVTRDKQILERYLSPAQNQCTERLRMYTSTSLALSQSVGLIAIVHKFCHTHASRGKAGYITAISKFKIALCPTLESPIARSHHAPHHAKVTGWLFPCHLSPVTCNTQPHHHQSRQGQACTTCVFSYEYDTHNKQA
jgi:hypothetical protein